MLIKFLNFFLFVSWEIVRKKKLESMYYGSRYRRINKGNRNLKIEIILYIDV